MKRVRNFAWGVVGSMLAMGCLLGGPSTSGQKIDAENTGQWKLADPIRYENLTVFPVIASQLFDTRGFATLDQALASGEALISERGTDAIRRSRDGHPIFSEQQGASVNQLVLINRGTKPLLLLAGELVSGGKQDRIISKDRIVPPGAEPLPLDVFCVEQGRWSSGVQFSAAQLMVHPSVRERAVADQKQTEVWEAVRNGTTSSSVGGVAGGGSGAGVAVAVPPPGSASQTVTITGSALNAVVATEAPTQSYKAIYQSSRVENSVDPFVDEVQRRFARRAAELKGEQIVGVVVAYGGEVAWSDVFASSDLFNRYWPKLLRSYVVEALARPRTKEQASLDDAREFLAPLGGHESIESEPGIYSLKQITQGRYVEIDLEAFRPKLVTLHSLRIHRAG